MIKVNINYFKAIPFILEKNWCLFCCFVLFEMRTFSVIHCLFYSASVMLLVCHYVMCCSFFFCLRRFYRNCGLFSWYRVVFCYVELFLWGFWLLIEICGLILLILLVEADISVICLRIFVYSLFSFYYAVSVGILTINCNLWVDSFNSSCWGRNFCYFRIFLDLWLVMLRCISIHLILFN